MHIRLTRERARDLFRSESAVLAIVLLLVAAVHIVNLATSLDDPYLRYRVGDESEYHDWARMIAHGNLLRQRSFFTTPLYAYFLGSLYALGIHHVAAVRAVNVLLVLGTVILVSRTSRRLFPFPLSIIPVLLIGFCLSPMFYELAPEKTSLVLFLCALTTHLVMGGIERPSLPLWFSAGIAGGMATLAHALFFVLLPSVLLTLLVLRLKRGIPVGKIILLFCAGFALSILPATVHNYIVDRDLVLVNYNGGQNFFAGNAAQNHSGMYSVPSFATATLSSEERDFTAAAQQATGRRLKPSEVSRYWFRRGWSDIADDPLLSVQRFARRLRWTFSSMEIRDARTFQFYRERLPVLGLPLWNFGLVAVLGLAGMVLARTDNRMFFPNFLVLSFSLALSMFFVFGRYRLPLLIPLSYLACGTIDRGWSAIRSRDRTTMVALGALLILAGIAVYGGQGYELRQFHADPAIDHINQGNNYLQEGDYSNAIGEFRQVIELTTEGPDASMAAAKLASSYMRMGRDAEAANLLQRYLDRYRDSTALWEEYCALEAKRSLASQSRPTASELEPLMNAVAVCEKAWMLKPNSLSSAVNLAALHIRAGALDKADAVYRKAGTWFEDSPSLWLRMSKFHAEYRGDMDQALSEAERAVQLGRGEPGAVAWRDHVRREHQRRAAGGSR